MKIPRIRYSQIGLGNLIVVLDYLRVVLVIFTWLLTVEINSRLLNVEETFVNIIGFLMVFLLTVPITGYMFYRIGKWFYVHVVQRFDL
jgi:hypothetical protein